MSRLAILALGAYEQHGKHLPFATDTIIAEAIIEKIKIYYKNNDDLVFLPIQNIGYSPEHCFNSKTKTISYSEAIENIICLAERCSLQNINKMLIINTHGGNSPIMSIAATEIRKRLAMFCAYSSWLRFGLPENILSKEQIELDIHAGFIETSVMLYIAPELVKMQYAKNFYNRQEDFIKSFKYLRAYGKHSFGWMIEDLNIDGACGNAAEASSYYGELIFSHAISAILEFIDDIKRFDGNFFN